MSLPLMILGAKNIN